MLNFKSLVLTVLVTLAAVQAAARCENGSCDSDNRCKNGSCSRR